MQQWPHKQLSCPKSKMQDVAFAAIIAQVALDEVVNSRAIIFRKLERQKSTPRRLWKQSKSLLRPWMKQSSSLEPERHVSSPKRALMHQRSPMNAEITSPWTIASTGAKQSIIYRFVINERKLRSVSKKPGYVIFVF
jgi:hypothetical protein